jgi:hypothetical protein
MYNIQQRQHTNRKAKTAFFFVMALLMLIISCPVKRMVNAGRQVPTATQQAAKIIDNRQQIESYAERSCCIEKYERTAASTESISFQANQDPHMDFIQTGFAIHHYLSTIHHQYNYTEKSASTSLPIFLRHRRLLI